MRFSPDPFPFALKNIPNELMGPTPRTRLLPRDRHKNIHRLRGSSENDDEMASPAIVEVGGEMAAMVSAPHCGDLVAQR